MTITEAPAHGEGVHAPVRRGRAVVWISGWTASLALMDEAGHISTCDIERCLAPEPSYLAIVVRAIGDRERVVILGPSSMRLALERAYVAFHHRPDRLVDVEHAGALERGDLIRRLHELAGEIDGSRVTAPRP